MTYLDNLRIEMARLIARGLAFPFNEDGTIDKVKLARLTALAEELNALAREFPHVVRED